MPTRKLSPHAASVTITTLLLVGATTPAIYADESRCPQSAEQRVQERLKLALVDSGQLARLIALYPQTEEAERNSAAACNPTLGARHQQN